VFFGNSAQFWLGLQDDYDLEGERMFEKNMYWEHVQQLETELISFIENKIQSN
jgi:plasmid maintenance system antidote protein VapI